jgi:hypothetical protein
MATSIERLALALERVDEEAAEIECPVCHMPSLDLPMQHYLKCARHDPETCHACSAP